jgi:transposase
MINNRKSDYEDLGIKTILITAVISLSVVIRYLYNKTLKEKRKHQKEIKEKDEQNHGGS